MCNTLESQVSLRGMAFVDSTADRPSCRLAFPETRHAMRTSVKSNESGMAIITALLVLMLASGLMAGMFAALIADQRSHATDRDQSVAYAAAHAGLEKLTASLAALLRHRLQPQRRADRRHRQHPPAIPGFQFTSPGVTTGSGYDITFTPDPGPGPNTGNPLATVGHHHDRQLGRPDAG